MALLEIVAVYVMQMLLHWHSPDFSILLTAILTKIRCCLKWYFGTIGSTQKSAVGAFAAMPDAKIIAAVIGN